MASKMTPLGVVTKWAGVPIALLLVGRFVIGPLLLPKMPANISKPAGDMLTEIQKKVPTLKSAPSVEIPAKTAATNSKSEQKSTPEKRDAKAATTTNDTTASTPPDAADQSGGPQVEITVHSDASSSTHTVHKTHHKKHTTVKKPVVKPETTDDGSFGGTQDPPTKGGTTDPPTGN